MFGYISQTFFLPNLSESVTERDRSETESNKWFFPIFGWLLLQLPF